MPQGISDDAGAVWAGLWHSECSFLCGALDIQIRGAATRLDASIQPYTDGQELQVTAHVIRDERLQPGGFGEIRQTLDVEAEQITTATGLTVPVYSGVRRSIYSRHPDDAQENSAADASGTAYTFHYGERVAPRRNSSCRAIFATPAPSTIRAISRTAVSPRWDRQRPRMSNSFQGYRRQPHQLMAEPHAPQRRRKGAPTLARPPGRLDRRYGDWRGGASRRIVRGVSGFALSVCELLFVSAVMQMGLALPWWASYRPAKRSRP